MTNDPWTDLDIPDFLRISAEERHKAWREWRGFPSQPAPMPANETDGPGSIARHLGYPENPLDARARAELRRAPMAEAERFRVADRESMKEPT
jgi:hypothetical protein